MKKIELAERNLFGLCPFVTAQEIIAGKWTILILHELSEGTKRFNELQKKIGVTHATLANHLKSLEHEGLVNKKIFPEVPPHVEYSLTEIGKNFQIVLDSIEIWGKNYIEFLKNRDKKNSPKA